MKTSMVPRDHVTVVWDRIEKYAEGCAKYTYGRFTAKDMLEGKLRLLCLDFRILEL